MEWNQGPLCCTCLLACCGMSQKPLRDHPRSCPHLAFRLLEPIAHNRYTKEGAERQQQSSVFSISTSIQCSGVRSETRCWALGAVSHAFRQQRAASTSEHGISFNVGHMSSRVRNNTRAFPICGHDGGTSQTTSRDFTDSQTFPPRRQLHSIFSIFLIIVRVPFL